MLELQQLQTPNPAAAQGLGAGAHRRAADGGAHDGRPGGGAGGGRGGGGARRVLPRHSRRPPLPGLPAVPGRNPAGGPPPLATARCGRCSAQTCCSINGGAMSYPPHGSNLECCCSYPSCKAACALGRTGPVAPARPTFCQPRLRIHPFPPFFTGSHAEDRTRPLRMSQPAQQRTGARTEAKGGAVMLPMPPRPPLHGVKCVPGAPTGGGDEGWRGLHS